MEHHLKKQQRGYLLVVAIVLIVIIAFAGMMIVHIFTNQTKATSHTAEMGKATYLATSGIEITKRDLLTKKTTCNQLNTLHNNEDLLDGQFSITGTKTEANSTLTSIGNNNIVLADATNFATQGIVKIGGEYIGYLKKTGNTLSNLTRGKAGTTLETHNAGDSVKQAQCFIQSTGAVPNMSATDAAKKTVNTIVVLGGHSGIPFSINGYTPIIGVSKKFEFSGSYNLVRNPSVELNGPGYPGSTILTNSTVTFKNNTSRTEVKNEVISSYKNHIEADIVQNANINNLFETYFNDKTTNEVKSLATVINHYTPGNINGTAGDIIWINDNVTLSQQTHAPWWWLNTYSFGSISNPIIVIINGNLSLTSNYTRLKIYGFLFVLGNIQFKRTGNQITGEGAIATTGKIDLQNMFNSIILSPDPDILSQAFSQIYQPNQWIVNTGLIEKFH